MMSLMIAAALMLASPQETPPRKTVEERLKELEEKLGGLEKRHQTLADENQALEKRIADGKAARENYAKQTASGWVKRYAKTVELTEKQSAELEELWLGWVKKDFEKPPDAAGWKSREAAIQGKLAPEQVPKLARAVRDEQEKYAKLSISSFVQAAKIAPERAAGFEKTVVARLTFSDEALIPQAHPEKQVGWWAVYGGVEQALPDLAPVLTEEEQARLRDTLAKWKPRK